MERAVWNGKEYLAIDIAQDYELESHAVKVSGKQFLCPDPNCKNRLLRYCHGDKYRPYFAHMKRGECDYASFDKGISSYVREIKLMLLSLLRNNGYEVRVDNKIDGRYIHLIVNYDGCMVAIELGTTTMLKSRTEVIAECCRKNGLRVQWIVVSDNHAHLREERLSWIKRQAINIGDLIIIDESGQNVTQLRLDNNVYMYKDRYISFHGIGNNIFSYTDGLQALAFGSTGFYLNEFENRFAQWLQARNTAYLESIRLMEAHEAAEREAAERARREAADREAAEKARRLAAEREAAEIVRRQKEEEESLRQKQAEEMRTELGKWFTPQVIKEPRQDIRKNVHADKKAQAYLIELDDDKLLDSGQRRLLRTSDIPVYVNGIRYGICKICGKEKPVRQFSKINGNKGICATCADKNTK